MTGAKEVFMNAYMLKDVEPDKASRNSTQSWT
jgi:hypothetical protein